MAPRISENVLGGNPKLKLVLFPVPDVVGGFRRGPPGISATTTSTGAATTVLSIFGATARLPLGEAVVSERLEQG